MNNNYSGNTSRQNYEQKIEEGISKFLKAIRWLIIPLLLIILFSSFTYTVREDEVAIVSRFGEVTKIIVDRDNEIAIEQNNLKKEYEDVQIINHKGLFFKTPFITSVQKETSKLLTYIAQPEKLNTNDKKQYYVAFYAQYEITHPALYQASFGSKSKASGILDDKIYPIVIERVNQIESQDFLTEKNILYSTLAEGLDELNAQVASYGIQLKDIEIYRTLLPDSNIDSTYNKMRAERDAAAQELISDGQERYDKTVAEVDRKAKEIIADAKEEAGRIRGLADGTAIEIYTNGYTAEIKDENGEVIGTKEYKGYTVDPEFYEFWRRLQAYRYSIDENTTIILDKNNPFLKDFTN